MHELRQSTGTTILIGPFLDDTDGKTPETAIDVTTIDCDLYKGVTKSNLSLTASGGVNDCVHVANGYYSLELESGNVDTLALGRLAFNVAGAMPLWEDIIIVTANYFDSKCSTDKLQVDVVQCGGSTVAAGAIPNAAADAAGGLPISDAGGLDIDTKLADTNEITVARMGALTDWIDGGRLDLLLDAIPTTAMRGTEAVLDATIGSITGGGLQLWLNYDAGSSSSDAYKNMIVLLYDNTTGEADVRYCTNYSGGSKVLTIDSVPGFTLTAGDRVVVIPAQGIIPDAAGTAATPGEVATALTDIQLDHLIAVADADDVVDDSIIAKMVSKAATADWSTYVNTTESLEAIRDRGDAEWISATGFSTHSAADVKTAIEAAGSHLALILADTGTDGVLLAATATSEQLVDDVWDEILTGATHNIPTSAGRRIREIGAFAIRGETAQGGTSVTITLDAGASASDGIYNRNLIAIIDGTGAGQTRQIADYDGTTKVASIDREWRTQPDATSEFVITASNVFALVDQGQAQAATATTITLRAYASSVDDTYLCNQVVIIAGTGRGQSRLIGGYNGTTKVVTICGDNWVTTPDNTSVYVLMPYGTTCTSCIGDYALGLINTECDAALTDYDPPTRTEATADKDEIITEVNNTEAKIDTLIDEIGGKWEIVGNQMIFYKADNITEIMRFNLFDSTGNPSMINVYKRERVP